MALLFIYALSAMVIAVCLWLFRYMNMTLSFAVPMVFLTTDLNTFSLIREETKNAAITADLDTAKKIQIDALTRTMTDIRGYFSRDITFL